MRVLAGTGLPPQTKPYIHPPLQERMERNQPHSDAISASGGHPSLSTLFEHDVFEPDLDTLFEFGLRGTPDGIAVMPGETSA
ncbi:MULTISPECIES: hypothetical protein [unclassified Streptomyces]|uniref:hypothetical protein n=1 Tax=unclassified Streptomyces TaxID=2593676 RepID=UPI003246D338